MPIFIPWLIGAAAVAGGAYLVKKLSEDGDTSNSYRSSADVERANEERRREAQRASQRKKMEASVRAVLAEHGIEVSDAERERFVKLALDSEDDTLLDEFIETLAPRAPQIREHDNQMEKAKAEVVKLEEMASTLCALSERNA